MAMVSVLLIVMLLSASLMIDAAASGCFFLVRLVKAAVVFFDGFCLGAMVAEPAPTLLAARLLLAATPARVRRGGVIELEL